MRLSVRTHGGSVDRQGTAGLGRLGRQRQLRLVQAKRGSFLAAAGRPKNGCFQTVVLEKPIESPLDCKEIQPVHPRGNQS